jgi:hypothetical protein
LVDFCAALNACAIEGFAAFFAAMMLISPICLFLN